MCGADAIAIAASNTSPSHASIARAVRTPREPPARARETVGGDVPRFCERGAVWFSCARWCYGGVNVGEILCVCIAQVSLLLRWDSKRRLLIPRERSVLDSRSVAIANADPSGVGARQARRLEEEKTTFVVAYFTREKLAHCN